MRGRIEEVRGRYRIRVRTADGRKQTLHTADTPERAEEVLAAYRAEVAEAGIADPHALTVRAWGEQWLTRRELDGVRGIHVERVTWATHVLAAPFADWPLETIRPHDVQDWISERLRAKARQGTGRRGESVETDRPISRQTVQHALRLLRQASTTPSPASSSRRTRRSSRSSRSAKRRSRSRGRISPSTRSSA